MEQKFWYVPICFSMLHLSILTHAIISTTARKYLSDAQICTSMPHCWRLGSEHPLITLRYLFLLEEATRSSHTIRHGTVRSVNFLVYNSTELFTPTGTSPSRRSCVTCLLLGENDWRDGTGPDLSVPARFKQCEQSSISFTTLRAFACSECCLRLQKWKKNQQNWCVNVKNYMTCQIRSTVTVSRKKKSGYKKGEE